MCGPGFRDDGDSDGGAAGVCSVGPRTGGDYEVAMSIPCLFRG